MADLSTNLAGLTIRTPLIVASCPATEDLAHLLECAEAGAGAAIIKSCMRYDRPQALSGRRRTYVDHRGIWATSSFDREILTVDQACDLTERATAATSMPIIGSVGVFDLEHSKCLDACHSLEQSGAAMIQLDMFYVARSGSYHDTMSELSSLLSYVSRLISIPLLPKLNLTIPAVYAVESFESTGIAGWSLLDSVPGPPPINWASRDAEGLKYIDHPRNVSLFGAWQFPLTRHYTDLVVSNSHLPVVAGGGVSDALDVLELLSLGASAVQVATPVLWHGTRWIVDTLKQLPDMLSEHHVGLKGSSSFPPIPESVDSHEEATFLPAVARIDQSRCRGCRRCGFLSFCQAIDCTDQGVSIDPGKCDGCGLCVFSCPQGALSVVGRDAHHL